MSILSIIGAYIATKLDLKQDKNSPIDKANKLTTARSIALSGDVTGNVEFDGSSDVTIATSVSDNSHNHIISNVDGLQTALDGKAALKGTASAAGGAGGNSPSYAGNSGSRTTVFGTSTDGKRVYYGEYVYGGQTSGYQPGGNGGYTTYDISSGATTTVLSTAGGRGSGGGGHASGGGYSGAGGAGLIKLTW